MNKRIRIYPYHFRVSAAKEIVNNLIKRGFDAVRVYPDRNYRPKPNDLVVNWGCSTVPKWKNPLQYKFQLLNDWTVIPNAINKLHSFARFKAKGVSCPDVTVTADVALDWLKNGKRVVGRRKLNGRGGEGIVMMNSPEEFVNCPLYTMYKSKRKEFRVHVFNGQAIDVQEKRKRNGYEGKVNSEVRSYDNGWVFCRKNVNIPETAIQESIKAVLALGLDFGGVDVVWNEKENKSYVLEANSAPGIEGTTVIKYADAIGQLAQSY